MLNTSDIAAPNTLKISQHLQNIPNSLEAPLIIIKDLPSLRFLKIISNHSLTLSNSIQLEACIKQLHFIFSLGTRSSSSRRTFCVVLSCTSEPLIHISVASRGVCLGGEFLVWVRCAWDCRRGFGPNISISVPYSFGRCVVCSSNGGLVWKPLWISYGKLSYTFF